MKSANGRILSSYRDPSGHVFFENNQLFRRINKCYLNTYYQARDSGLLQELVQKHLLIGHDDVEEHNGDDSHIIIRPKMVPFISYPYEWCFSQMKDAALVTLEIQRIAVSYGFSLKDAHGFNIQFDGGLPLLIDTLSFEHWDNTPWEAYRQFCEAFLIPLALMRYQSPYLNALLAKFLNGIPLEIGSKLLPFRSKLSIWLLLHIHLHAGRKNAIEGKGNACKELIRPQKNFNMKSMQGLCMSLTKAVQALKCPNVDSIWDTYYQSNICSKEALEMKVQFIREIVEKKCPPVVWDLGCNTGKFSILAAKNSGIVVAIDGDMARIERLYQQCKEEKIRNIYPLQMDLTNPSSAIGWELKERMSLFERGGCDLALALALIHHLCISANVPLDYVARFLARVSKQLIIEFVPKNDPQVKILLSSRKDIFSNYNIDAFELAFKTYFRIIQSEQIPGSDRTIYYMEHL